MEHVAIAHPGLGVCLRQIHLLASRPERFFRHSLIGSELLVDLTVVLTRTCKAANS